MSKLSAPFRVAPFMNVNKRKLLMNVLFEAQFIYCPLVWMLQSQAKQ